LANKKNIRSLLVGCEIPQTILFPTVDDVRFWLHIMEEHALFIKLGLPCSERNLIKKAEEFKGIFSRLLREAKGNTEKSNYEDLVGSVLEAVIAFREFKLRILHLLVTCELGGNNFPLFMDHLSREAEYFILLLEKAKEFGLENMNRISLPINSMTGETVFWHRIMGDHSKFILSKLDPSEKKFIEITLEFIEEFDDLYHHAKDLQSMLRSFRPVGTFDRFVDESQESVEELKEFQLGAESLIRECRILGIIPAEMARHVAEEAQYFLNILAQIDKLV